MSEQLSPDQADSLENIPAPAESRMIVGHDEAARNVVDAYRAGKLHHALLLTGPKGIGKATFAFHVARYLLENPDASQEHVAFGATRDDSAIFRQIASGASPGVLHLSRPFDERSKKFKAAITVDEMRRISKFLSLRSHDGSYRVVIVDAADDMNRNAANALLKNLEEPPSRVLFLLVSHSPGSLLPTIRSRCQVMRMQPLQAADLARALGAVGVSLPQEDGPRQALLDRAGGSARQAILLAEYGGFDIISAIDRVVRARTNDVLEAYKVADAVAGKDGEIPFQIFNAHMLDIVEQATRNAAANGDLARAARIAEFWAQTRMRIAETETYNLDKRQHVVGLLGGVSIAIA